MKQQLSRVILWSARILHIDGLIPDKVYLRLLYRRQLNQKLNLKDPRTVNEKLQWLKLYDRRPEYSTMVDKYAVKKYVADIIGEEYIIPTLGVWDKPEDIKWDYLPDSFCLKCTHDSGTIIIVRDKTMINKPEIINQLNKWLKRDFWILGREWPYKNVPRRIIAEKLLDVDPKINDLYDYKFFCFNGEPKVLLFCSERKNGTSKWDFFDMEMNRLPVSAEHHETTKIEIKKVLNLKTFEEMKGMARALSETIPYVSVDLYFNQERIYFGEMTFYSGCGHIHYNPISFDTTLGDMLHLPNK